MIAPGSLDVERIVTGPLEGNCYLVCAPSGDAVIIDPGDEAQRIAARLKARKITVGGVLATHAHEDHIGAAAPLVEATGAPFHLHHADTRLLKSANFYRAVLHERGPIRIPNVDIDLAGRESLRFGSLEVSVIHTPGHTRGGVCFAIDREIYTGDTLMSDRPGRTDFPGGDPVNMDESVARILARGPDDAVICPGHGDPAPLAQVRRRLAHQLGAQG